MNPLHSHDIVENLKEAIVHPLGITEHSTGSDPLTHKKMREEVNTPSGNVSSTTSTNAELNNTNTSEEQIDSTAKETK